jgi:hypothetical protein
MVKYSNSRKKNKLLIGVSVCFRIQSIRENQFCTLDLDIDNYFISLKSGL